MMLAIPLAWMRTLDLKFAWTNRHGKRFWDSLVNEMLPEYLDIAFMLQENQLVYLLTVTHLYRRAKMGHISLVG